MSDAATRRLRPIRGNLKESDFQLCVVQAAKLFGWRVYFTWNSLHSPAGYPDLTLCHPQYGLLFAELKSATGKLRPEQVEWLGALHQAGQRVIVWRPAQWLDGTIEAVLKGEMAEDVPPADKITQSVIP